MTANKDAMLRIDLKAYEAPAGKNDTAYVVYGKFWVGNANSSYTMEEISEYTGKRKNNTSEPDYRLKFELELAFKKELCLYLAFQGKN